MAETDRQVLLNLGCGFAKKVGWVNVDGFDVCDPDVVWDLNKFPYPWDDNSADAIEMFHVLEHLEDWWPAFEEMARIVKPGGSVEIRVPDESSTTALTYRDHNHVFSLASFHGIQEANHSTNAWAATVVNSIPLKLEGYYQVPHKKYGWMVRFPRLLRFCADHLRNYIHEQRFIFRKIG